MLQNSSRLKRTVKRILIKTGLMKEYFPHDSFIQAEKIVAESKTLLDMGCGSSPHPKATAALDKYLTPDHRNFGTGNTIDPALFKQKGILFVQSDMENTPL